jgi:hypothetical protein
MKRPLALVFALTACGPNYRYAYEGEGAFERCYALDYDGSTPPEVRQRCWAAWLQSYAYGASVDRVEYARSRMALAPNPPGPAVPSSPPAASPTPLQNDPPTLSPAAPPPSTVPTPNLAGAWQRAQLSAGGTAVAAPPPTAPAPASTPAPEPPGHACATTCREQWQRCGDTCPVGQTVCVARCDDTYRDCMRGCY